MKNLYLNTNGFESVIHCGAGALKEYLPSLKCGQLFAVTDENVYSLYFKYFSDILGDVPVYVLKPGEGSKNIRNLVRILQKMTEAGMKRSCTVLALGGGVVGDIAGLAAALYMRGVNLVQIPTTLLSQVDSSVGGKTAVDFKGIKNLIGTFYQPHTVIIDPMFLKTLPIREIRCGLGEIVKYGALDKNIYVKLLKNCDNLKDLNFLEKIIYDCVEHKKKVVECDERDLNGTRKTLNLGHTTGHAFELFYKRKSHGEFVLIGMYYEMLIAQKLGFGDSEYFDGLKRLIKKVIKIPVYKDVGVAAGYALFDKKNPLGKISLIVPESAGKCKEIKLDVNTYSELLDECVRDTGEI